MKTWAEHDSWMFFFDALRDALVKAQEQRDALRGFDDTTGEPEWVVHERRVMQAEVNRLRTRLNRPSVDMAPIEAAERQACGHSDYTKKFALHCADVVMDR